ncbi:hypothetical protein CLOP_g1977 [Closterium sp. NIES-67]|nr:hypothetical protein CLOP_g1977 [Closterium sp. NIES-67]
MSIPHSEESYAQLIMGYARAGMWGEVEGIEAEMEEEARRGRSSVTAAAAAAGADAAAAAAAGADAAAGRAHAGAAVGVGASAGFGTGAFASLGDDVDIDIVPAAARDSVAVCNALVVAYGRAGRMAQMEMVVNRLRVLSPDGTLKLESYNTLLEVYARRCARDSRKRGRHRAPSPPAAAAAAAGAAGSIGSKKIEPTVASGGGGGGKTGNARARKRRRRRRSGATVTQKEDDAAMEKQKEEDEEEEEAEKTAEGYVERDLEEEQEGGEEEEEEEEVRARQAAALADVARVVMEVEGAGHRFTMRTYAAVMQALGLAGHFDQVKGLVAAVRAQGLALSPPVYRMLLDVFGRGGRLGDALLVLEDLKRAHPGHANLSAYNTLLLALQDAHPDHMLAVLALMASQGVLPNRNSLAAMLAACEAANSPHGAARLYLRVVDTWQEGPGLEGGSGCDGKAGIEEREEDGGIEVGHGMEGAEEGEDGRIVAEQRQQEQEEQGGPQQKQKQQQQQQQQGPRSPGLEMAEKVLGMCRDGLLAREAQRVMEGLRANGVTPSSRCYSDVIHCHSALGQWQPGLSTLSQALSHGCIPSSSSLLALTHSLASAGNEQAAYQVLRLHFTQTGTVDLALFWSVGLRVLAAAGKEAGEESAEEARFQQLLGVIGVFGSNVLMGLGIPYPAQPVLRYQGHGEEFRAVAATPLQEQQQQQPFTPRSAASEASDRSRSRSSDAVPRTPSSNAPHTPHVPHPRHNTSDSNDPVSHSPNSNSSTSSSSSGGGRARGSNEASSATPPKKPKHASDTAPDAPPYEPLRAPEATESALPYEASSIILVLASVLSILVERGDFDEALHTAQTIVNEHLDEYLNIEYTSQDALLTNPYPAGIPESATATTSQNGVLPRTDPAFFPLVIAFFQLARQVPMAEQGGQGNKSVLLLFLMSLAVRCGAPPLVSGFLVAGWAKGNLESEVAAKGQGNGGRGRKSGDEGRVRKGFGGRGFDKDKKGFGGVRRPKQDDMSGVAQGAMEGRERDKERRFSEASEGGMMEGSAGEDEWELLASVEWENQTPGENGKTPGENPAASKSTSSRNGSSSSTASRKPADVDADVDSDSADEAGTEADKAKADMDGTDDVDPLQDINFEADPQSMRVPPRVLWEFKTFLTLPPRPLDSCRAVANAVVDAAYCLGLRQAASEFFYAANEARMFPDLFRAEGDALVLSLRLVSPAGAAIAVAGLVRLWCSESRHIRSVVTGQCQAGSDPGTPEGGKKGQGSGQASRDYTPGLGGPRGSIPGFRDPMEGAGLGGAFGLGTEFGVLESLHGLGQAIGGRAAGEGRGGGEGSGGNEWSGRGVAVGGLGGIQEVRIEIAREDEMLYERGGVAMWVWETLKGLEVPGELESGVDAWGCVWRCGVEDMAAWGERQRAGCATQAGDGGV